MRRLMGSFALVVGILGVGAPAAALGAASVDRVHDIDTVLAVRFDETFPVASLMRATCDWSQFVRRPDGSGIETMHCTLSAEPVMIAAFQGQPPAQAFVHGGGPCLWTSDYWFAHDGSIVMASAFDYVVSASGRVNVRAVYPARPLDCG
jgi:hypothetical protein